MKLAALESNKSLDLEKKEGRIDDLLRVSLRVLPASAVTGVMLRFALVQSELGCIYIAPFYPNGTQSASQRCVIHKFTPVMLGARLLTNSYTLIY